MSCFKRSLASKLPAGLELSGSQLGRLEQHFSLLLTWNRRLNLTSITDMEAAVDRHYAESLYLASLLPRSAFTVADVGSGAGFPGIPLAVALPWAAVTLVESDQRKAVFLREATSGLGNVVVESKRLSELSGNWDWLVSRAVRWSELALWAVTHVRHVALLTTRSEAGAINRTGTISLQVHPLSMGSGRVVAIGAVPRETC